MKLTAIIGRAGSGKSHFLLTEAWKNIRAGEPERIKFLVPEQATHHAERRLLSPGDIAGCLVTEVLSFSRLVNRVTETAHRSIITEIDKRFILASILRRPDFETDPFTSVVGRPGFISALSQQIQMMKRAGEMETVEPIDAGNAGTFIFAKLDFAGRILQRYNDELLKLGLADNEDCVGELARIVGDIDWLEGTSWFIDSFSGFTPLEKSVLEGLFASAADVKIAICLDTDSQKEKLSRPRELFTGNRELYGWLERHCAEKKYDLEPMVLDIHSTKCRFRNKGLEELEKNLFHRNFKPGQTQGLNLMPVSSLRDAARRIAVETKRAVAEGARYRDIAVVLRSHGDVTDLLQEAFESAEIPYFIDRREPLTGHPLCRFILGLWELVLKNFHRDSLLTVLRTGLTPSTYEEIDRLENYILEYGLNFDSIPNEWLEQNDRISIVRKKRLDGLSKIAREVLGPLKKFASGVKEIHASGSKVSDYIDATMEFLALWGVAESVEDNSESDGQRIYELVLSVLQSTREKLGDEKMSPGDFAAILRAALDVLSEGHIPLALDAVIIGEIQRSRFEDASIVFLCGLFDGQFPTVPSGRGLFDDRELDILAGSYGDWATDYSRLRADEEYLFYIACTRARDALYLLYPGEDLDIPSSPFLRDMLKATGLSIDTETSRAEKPVLNIQEMIGKIAGGIRSGKRNSDLLSAYQYIIENSDYAPGCRKILGSLTYSNDAKLETRKRATRRKNIETLDASRLFAFGACPFRYFAQYDLKVKLRETGEITPRETGTFVHEVLERCFSKWFSGSEDVDFEDPLKYAYDSEKQAMEIAYGFTGAVLMDGGREEKRLKTRLIPLIRDYVISEMERMKHSVLRPAMFEYRFGVDGNPGVVLGIEKFGPVTVRGALDRVDVCELGDSKFGIAMDYKVSREKTDLPRRVNQGIEIQIPLYIAALKDVLGITPIGGILGYLNKKKDVDSETARRKSFPRRGLYRKVTGLNDESPVGAKYDGKGDDEFDEILSNGYERIISYAERLFDGDIKVWPYLYGKEIACDMYCDFKDICRFDSVRNPCRDPEVEF